ncbi:antirepressor [Enterobacterales bacterium]|nr:antirepressor [Enterobacterales bacterium]
MDWSSQFTKLKKRFAKGVVEITIPSAGGSQSMTCLALRKLAGWLNTISPNKVKPEIRENVIQYQEECDDVLYEYWTRGEAVNPRKSTTKCLPGKVNAEQQEAIKQLVLTRGKALPKDKQAKAMITMWSALKTHFGVSYKSIDENQFTEALSLAARIPLEGEFIGKEESPVAEETYTMTISRSELCSLCWVWNAAEHMREVLVATHPALELLRSPLASTFDTMGFEYQRTLNDGKEILERETQFIMAHPYDVKDAAWRSVLPRLRKA